MPSSRTVPDTTQLWPKHVLATQEDKYPGQLKGWEIKVLEREMDDHDLVGWYRNPTGASASLRVPYRGAQYDQSMYPDFVLFHQTDEGIQPSIVDPHGFHLADATAKLKGLAEYAARHGDFFDRIDSVAEVDGNPMALDLRSEVVRQAVTQANDAGVKVLFEKYGGNYS